MLSKFFIERPIFASVLAIVLMIAGIFSILNLPVERFPDIAPPRITVSTTYTGASAETVEESVTQILEQQIKGLDHLLYFSSSSDSSGRSRISISFNNGTNPDTAQVQVQNAINGAINRLPEEVQRQGVNVYKSLGDTHMVIALYDTRNQSNNVALSDYMMTHLEQEIARIDGVGEVDVFGSQYAMRIWLNPLKLKQYALMPSDIRSAISEQNTQVVAGAIGELPVIEEQYFNAKATAGSRLKSVEEFENIVIKSNNSGGFVYLKDVARVELGAENYQSFNTINGYPSAGMGISLASGANALKTAALVKAKIDELSKQLPEGYAIVYPRDNTTFIQESVTEVVKTLFEAIVLVIVVMFLFLQNWRATLIPALTVPVVILGTMAVLYVLGMSINTLTLFALVLAIGLLVDDAIVVVENIERLTHEKQLNAKQASIESMQEISGALIGVTLVLTAVFIPMAFFGGSTGVIYRQFSITLVVAMVLSLLVALILIPALCALFLKPQTQAANWAQRFNLGLNWLKNKTLTISNWTFLHKKTTVTVFFVLLVGFAFLYRALPTSFLPSEDQGILSIQFKLQDGAPMSKSQEIGERIREYFLQYEKDNVDLVLIRYGRNASGTGQNLGQGFIALKHWDQRKGAENSAQQIRQRALDYFKKEANATINVSMPPSVNGLGQTNGLEFWLLDVNGRGLNTLTADFQNLQEQAKQYVTFENLDKKSNSEQTTLAIHIQQKAALALGVNLSAVNSTLSAAWGGVYINDFIDRGRIKRVMMQGDAQFRSKPEDLNFWYVRNNNNNMVSFDQFATTAWASRPEVVKRFMGYSALEAEADTVTGVSSGQAMQDLQNLIDQNKDINLAWSGLSFEENQSSNQALFLYLVSIGFVFLCLAALYESWTIPTAVMSAIPLGVGGNIILTSLFSFPNDIYFQIALLTTIGLSCKNAILLIEFASEAQKQGKTAIQAALEAIQLRLRPIVMTSLAFGAGIIPLIFAFGAGAVSRQEIGVSVFGGVIFGTVLVLIFVPFMYVLIRSVLTKKSVSV